jgi:hypothetical protein
MVLARRAAIAAYDVPVTYRSSPARASGHRRHAGERRARPALHQRLRPLIIEMVIGSTTEYVLRNSPAPVFLTR